jgi:hypothetical protein
MCRTETQNPAFSENGEAGFSQNEFLTFLRDGILQGYTLDQILKGKW